MHESAKRCGTCVDDQPPSASVDHVAQPKIIIGREAPSNNSAVHAVQIAARSASLGDCANVRSKPPRPFTLAFFWCGGGRAGVQAHGPFVG